MTTFAELGVSEPVLRSLEQMGFEEPTPIQSQAIPCMMEGRDVLAQALTGTGKTGAFGIPLVERIDIERRAPQAIVLAPTRELAVQVAEQLNQIGRHKGLRLVAIYGGQPIYRQMEALSRGVHAIVATPGRLMDHMRRGTIDLTNVSLLVLDEADQMLEMGFQEDVEFVMSHLPEERCTALFSATMPKPILDIVHRFMKNPEMLRLSKGQELTVEAIEQIYYTVPFPRKVDVLCRVLDARRPDRAMVFCATKRMVDEVTERLQARGYQSSAIHGDISQPQREKVLRAFREGRSEILIATDVAARGIDVPDITLVVNFDMPPDPEYYVHRIGRTGRYGRSGVAITFVNPREMRELKMIERATGAHIQAGDVPTQQEVEERENQLLEERLLDMLTRGKWQPYRAVIEDLLEDNDPIDVAAAALALVAAGPARKGAAGSEKAGVPAGDLDRELRMAAAGASDQGKPRRPGPPYGKKPYARGGGNFQRRPGPPPRKQRP